MKKYNVCIIGAGNMGCLNDLPGSVNEHKMISFAKAVKEHEGFNLTCFVEPDYDNACLAQDNYCVHAYNNIETAFNHEFIDVVIVTTPDETHFSVLKQLLECHKRNPFKLCLCEKPLCETSYEAKEIIDLYKKVNIALMVDYTRRYLPYIRQLKQKYDNGEFGDIVDYSIVYNRGLLHAGSHISDFVNWFFNGKLNDLSNVKQVEHIPYRVSKFELFFEKYYWREQRIFNESVPSYFDYHTQYVMDNAYNYLVNKEGLFCTGEDGLKALELLGV